MVVGLTVHVLDALEQFAPVQVYETAVGQLAVKVDDAPAEMEDGLAVSVQVGAAVETPTIALTMHLCHSHLPRLRRNL